MNVHDTSASGTQYNCGSCKLFFMRKRSYYNTKLISMHLVYVYNVEKSFLPNIHLRGTSLYIILVVLLKASSTRFQGVRKHLYERIAEMITPIHMVICYQMSAGTVVSGSITVTL